MDVLNLKLDEQDALEVRRIEQSIDKWSLELVKMIIQADGLKNTITGLYQARAERIGKFLEASKVDAGRIMQQRFDSQTGMLTVILGPPREDGMPPPSPPSEVRAGS